MEGVRKIKSVIAGGVAVILTVLGGVIFFTSKTSSTDQNNETHDDTSSIPEYMEVQNEPIEKVTATYSPKASLAPIVHSIDAATTEASSSNSVSIAKHYASNKTAEEPALTPIGSSTSQASKPKKKKKKKKKDESYEWDGPVLNSYAGIIAGPSGNETYYNLDMSGVISIMKNCGYDYNYWVRDDGVKMYGNFIMVAADLNIRPRGSIVPTSLGPGIVCDTGGFVNWDSTRLDIATTW